MKTPPVTHALAQKMLAGLHQQHRTACRALKRLRRLPIMPDSAGKRMTQSQLAGYLSDLLNAELDLFDHPGYDIPMAPGLTGSFSLPHHSAASGLLFFAVCSTGALVAGWYYDAVARLPQLSACDTWPKLAAPYPPPALASS
jgi:hypothetical protein